MSNRSRSLALAVFMLATACTDPAPASMPDGGSGSRPPILNEELCERSDTCNILGGSVEECIQELDAALAPLPKNQRAEIDLLLKGCLAHPSCDGYAACLVGLLEGEALVRDASMVVSP